ncbi:2Fe-2S iron-sulfur cluster-binding protein [Alkalihalobacterium chitinilyticum]|uniref:(2Fe-2S)-binding protein n=1 Tax=Alkalihalobacterium chitinilyticum TaxID=2980103 RepID=A0ABT5VG36_9BACI|nr:2Fe-2S iron-sulfur cluster-binding protein [Alkalihalobacterium chitinilyticum]MDE5414399.1 (2Fe-2S)-binding protein [Alkalihalobacterium chitinilyticum]
MAKITVPGHDSFEVTEGTKLVLALEDHGVDILHRCGGKAKCTTCRVEVLDGEFGELTDIEKTAFSAKGIDANYRLSCQVFVKSDATIKPMMTVSESGLDAGPRPSDS